METIQITTELLTQLKAMYPSISEHGDRTLVTYALSRHVYNTSRQISQPQLPIIN